MFLNKLKIYYLISNFNCDGWVVYWLTCIALNNKSSYNTITSLEKKS
jgi:hypothetical protein